MSELKLQHSAVIKSVDSTKEGVLTIRGIASMYRTPDGMLQIDRDNELVNTDFMDLESYRKNPILVFQHDWSRPVGKVIDIENKNGALHITAEVYKLTGEENIYEAVQKGIIKSLSISTVPHSMIYRDTLDGEILEVESSTLVEISITTVQSNQEALFDVIAEKSPTIQKKVLAEQNGMTCDELDGSCAFKSELKGKTLNLEKEDTMSKVTKEPNVEPEKEPAKEPEKEPEVAPAVEPEATTNPEPETDATTESAKESQPKFDEDALVAAIELAEAKKAELAEMKAQEAAKLEAAAKAKEEADAKARVDNAFAYIKERKEEILAIPDEDFDPDTVEDFYEVVTDAADAIEQKVISIVQSASAAE